ncbi:putative NADH:ubiquinone reductase (H(+)-translocating) [Rosa chinensis]|uniref:Putative NADH:ubiquinone reductase (H(+)-translocating) n=1 Tax=Rosa chinensis TaxID=74649 RepID=A0A2P6QE36_ROSCH|nr:putative NADH:ubiquinone reductase (H(+)-translocating) [Rosa chinensis]
MASRLAARFFSRRMSSSGKILSEEEKAAENVTSRNMELAWDVKTEQEKLEKLARKGPKPEDKATAGPGESITDAKPSDSSSTAKVSTDKYRNYAVVAGVMTAAAALGWYIKGSEKKAEVQD